MAMVNVFMMGFSGLGYVDLMSRWTAKAVVVILDYLALCGCKNVKGVDRCSYTRDALLQLC